MEGVSRELGEALGECGEKEESRRFYGVKYGQEARLDEDGTVSFGVPNEEVIDSLPESH